MRGTASAVERVGRLGTHRGPGEAVARGAFPLTTRNNVSEGSSTQSAGVAGVAADRRRPEMGASSRRRFLAAARVSIGPSSASMAHGVLQHGAKTAACYRSQAGGCSCLWIIGVVLSTSPIGPIEAQTDLPLCHATFALPWVYYLLRSLISQT